MASLDSNAEKRALEALGMKTFQGIRLEHIKDTLAQMLSHIRSSGHFVEYTQHDISHVDGMLGLLDILIPEQVAHEVMTPADWLMLVLSIYFHDLGMLVTRKEFERRESDSGYRSFRDTADLSEYGEVSGEELEKALYQNYVRKHHGDRIHRWIMEAGNSGDTDENPVLKLLGQLLGSLDGRFREDLACICRSHQEPLARRIDEYKTQQPYEQNSRSEVNMLYIAVLLRTADLLHVNSERAPLVDYLVISPQNPYSRREWVQQRSVQQIRPKKEKNREGICDPHIEQHRFEVVATFDDENAYSHFMDYLRYAEKELKECYDLCRDSAHRHNNRYVFPWDGICRDSITTRGFNARKLMFEIDKKNILNLLIGHTLYSHANVVLRELTQNAIDACRLMGEYRKGGLRYTPKVRIEWDPAERILTISDNGTGMNEQIILDYLLKVGSSRYQTAEFREKHASFHSISRFGIGLLTCFMISDEIEITTRWHEEPKAHRLKIRNVDGEYLLRNDASSETILDREHGSTFRLKVRPDAQFDDIEEDLRNWVVVPRCEVTLHIGDKSVAIGATSEHEAMKQFLAGHNIHVDNDQHFRLEHKEQNGMSIHYLLRKDEIFGFWSLATGQELLSGEVSPIGTCIEGIKVSDRTPGFDIRNYVALVNCTGKDSPTTNVARDRLEQSAEQERLLGFLYDVYLGVVKEQIEYLEKSYSLSWSVNRASYAIDRMMGTRRGEEVPFTSKRIFDERLAAFECLLLDNGNELRITSLEKLGPEVWTIESAAFSSAVQLTQEIRGCTKTAYGITRELSAGSDPQICDVYSTGSSMRHRITDLFLDRYEVSRIRIDEKSREIRFCWAPRTDRWLRSSVLASARISRYNRTNNTNLYIMNRADSVETPDTEGSHLIASQYGYFLLAGNPLCDYMRDLALPATDGARHATEIIGGYLVYLSASAKKYDEAAFDKFFDDDDYNYMEKELWKHADKERLRKILGEMKQIRRIDFNKYYIQA